jgi:hypothetical protein
LLKWAGLRGLCPLNHALRPRDSGTLRPNASGACHSRPHHHRPRTRRWNRGVRPPAPSGGAGRRSIWRCRAGLRRRGRWRQGRRHRQRARHPDEAGRAGARHSALGTRGQGNQWFFFIGLSAVDTDVQCNIQLLKEQSWFDIPIVLHQRRPRHPGNGIRAGRRVPSKHHWVFELFTVIAAKGHGRLDDKGGICISDIGKKNALDLSGGALHERPRHVGQFLFCPPKIIERDRIRGLGRVDAHHAIFAEQ